MQIPFFCVEPFKNISITKRLGNLGLAPCCGYEDEQLINNLLDFNYNNDYHFNNIRQQWKQGEVPAGCATCVKDESSTFTSRRQNSYISFMNKNPLGSKELADVKLQSIDYWLGDTCNMACIMCGPQNSSLWKKEMQIKGPEARKITNKEWDKFDKSNLNYIHFHGGEPLLHSEHIELLNALPNLGQVTVNYNTNASIRPNQQLLDIWDQCKKVEVMLSIDDTDERFKYIRYPIEWDAVKNNVAWMIAHCGSNVEFSIIQTVNILNQYYSETVPAWLESSDYSIRLYQQKAVGNLAPDADIVKAINYLDSIDARRSTSWKQVFPRAAEKLLEDAS
jgi:organic radical activating enzyme